MVHGTESMVNVFIYSSRLGMMSDARACMESIIIIIEFTIIIVCLLQATATLSRKKPPIGCIVYMAVDRGVHVYNMTCAARDPTGSRKERVLQFRPGKKKKACSMRGSNLGLRVHVQGANPCS